MDIVLLYHLARRYFRKKYIKKVNKGFQAYVAEQQQLAYKKNPKNAFFYPDLPNKEAALAITLKTLGYKIHNEPDEAADIKVAWENHTYRKKVKENQALLKDAWNVNSLDISKSYTDIKHQEVFGYSTRLNPEEHHGIMLEKIELNAYHQARIVQGPQKGRDGYIYQKLINNQEGKYLFEDIRPVYIKGEIPFVYLNYRLKGKRFSAKKYKAFISEPRKWLSAWELEKTAALCDAMGVDYAEIDGLRDRDDGRFYIVDVNTTAFGPANGLSYGEKLKALEMYQEVLRTQLSL